MAVARKGEIDPRWDRILRDFEVARAGERDKKRQDWVRYNKYYQSEHLQVPEEDWIPVPHTPFVYAKVEEIHADMVAAPSTLIPRPLTLGSAERRADAQRAVEYVLQVNQWEKQDSDSERVREKLGHVLYRVVFDPTMEKPFGQIRVQWVHPANFFPDPTAYEIEDCDFVIYMAPRSVARVREQYGDRAAALMPEEEGLFQDTEIYGQRPAVLDKQHPLVKAERDDAVSVDTMLQRGRVRVFEYWYKDDEGVHVLIAANGLILKDSKAELKGPIYRHGRYPFISVPWESGDKEFWGHGVVERLTKLQDSIDMLDQQTEISAMTVSRPLLIVGWRNVKDPKMVSSRPALVVPVRDVNQIKRLEGSVIPPHIPGHRQTKIQEMDQTTGRFDILRGQRPVGVPTATGLAILNEQGTKRTRDAIMNKYLAMGEMGFQIFELIKQFWTEERWLCITRGSESEFFRIQPDTFTRVPKRELALDGSARDVLGEDGKPETEEACFAFHWEGGPSFRLTKAFLWEQGLGLFNVGAMDLEGLYDLIELPNKREVLERIRQKVALGLDPRLPLPAQAQPEEHPLVKLLRENLTDTERRDLARLPPEDKIRFIQERFGAELFAAPPGAQPGGAMLAGPATAAVPAGTPTGGVTPGI